MRLSILDDYQGVALDMADWSPVRARGIEIVVERHPFVDEDAAARALADSEIVAAMRERTPFPKSLVERLPKLKLLITTGMRNASFDMAALKDRGVTVCGTGGPGGGNEDTAELAWGLILGAARRIAEDHAFMRHGGWQTHVGHRVAGKTLGLLGLGRLGSAVARVGLAFGMKAIAWSQNLTAEKAAEQGVERVEKDELFRRSDILSVHLVLSARSRGLVGAREIGLMKPSAILVNTSRGPICRYRSGYRGAQGRAARLCRVRRLRQGAAADRSPAAAGAERDPDSAYRLRHRRELPQLVPADRRERHRLSSTASRFGSSEANRRAMSGDDADRSARRATTMSPRSPRSMRITCCTGWPRSRKCRRSTDEIGRRRDEILAHGLPYLVAERGGRVVGYCYAGPFRPRIGYRFTLEDSIYVDPAEIGRGIGRALLEPVLARCADARLPPDGRGDRRPRDRSVDPAARSARVRPYGHAASRSGSNSAAGSTSC